MYKAKVKNYPLKNIFKIFSVIYNLLQWYSILNKFELFVLLAGVFTLADEAHMDSSI